MVRQCYYETPTRRMISNDRFSRTVIVLVVLALSSNNKDNSRVVSASPENPLFSWSSNANANSNTNLFTYRQAFEVDLGAIADDNETTNNGYEGSIHSETVKQQRCYETDEESCYSIHTSNDAHNPVIQQTTSVVAFETTSPTSSSRLFYITKEEDDDDDDDDNNDDGSSSMLSTASLVSKQDRHASYYSASLVPAASSTTASKITSRKRRRIDSMTAIGRQQHSLALLKLRGGDTMTTSSSPVATANTSNGIVLFLTSVLFQSELSKRLFVTAFVTLIFEGCIGHVLEFFKIVMQTSTSKSYRQVYKDITSEKGIVGLWDGFIPWGVLQAIFKGAVFGIAHAYASQLLLPLSKSYPNYLPLRLAQTMAGGIGGGFQGLVLSPTLLLKTRVMTNPIFRGSGMSLLDTTLKSFSVGYDVVKSEGLRTLMKGSNVFAMKRVFDWSSRYFFSDVFETLFLALIGQRSTLTVTEKSVASLLGGIASTCVTLPLDVLVAKTQDAKKAGVRVSAISMFRTELQEKGLHGLRAAYMRGFEARLLHVCLTTMVVKTFTPVVYDILFSAS